MPSLPPSRTMTEIKEMTQRIAGGHSFSPAPYKNEKDYFASCDRNGVEAAYICHEFNGTFKAGIDETALISPPYRVVGKEYHFTTFAMVAIAYNNNEALDCLVTHPLFNIDARNADGWTALHVAAALKNEDAIFTLLDANADPMIKTADTEMTAYDICPDIIGKHPVFNTLKKEQERQQLREMRRIAFVANQEKLKRLAAGLPAELPVADTPAGNLSSVLDHAAEEEEPVVEEDNKLSTREKMLAALLVNASPDIMMLYIAEEAKERRLAEAFHAVIDKIDVFTLDKALAKHERIITSIEKARLQKDIDAHHRDDLKDVFNYRLQPQKKFVSEIDYHAGLLQKKLDQLVLQDEGPVSARTGFIDLLKQQAFTANMDHALKTAARYLSSQDMLDIKKHMETRERPDLVATLDPYLPRKALSNLVNEKNLASF